MNRNVTRSTRASTMGWTPARTAPSRNEVRGSCSVMLLSLRRETSATGGGMASLPGWLLGHPARVEDVLHGGAVLASELVGAGGGVSRVVRAGFDLDPGGVPDPGDAGADNGPVQAPDDLGGRDAGGAPHLLRCGIERRGQLPRHSNGVDAMAYVDA